MELKEICEARIEEGLQTIRFTRDTKPRTRKIRGTNIVIPENEVAGQRREDGSIFGQFTKSVPRSGCFVCGGMDHIKVNCPKASRPMSQVICEICGVKGHNKHRCPNQGLIRGQKPVRGAVRL